ncbi:TetR/AcrR family transcriptional regulator [Marinobacterium arenosum]|uniref:TetR/AcrR family transcriptional regulator n=1 Tax=Marinobacterium arenosum TaxID=2862496 RepID=UPI001C9839D1|nr:TetR/AcrR family transcriptional regulator [Marinobacterium arenosum]MBY4677298.1 TetR/AcrR family transcriptional regulator [Marinobacterium arenosum]
MSKTKPKSEEKRRLILNAAVELFTEQGLMQTSMDQIAKRAGVSKQTVYSHYGNKEELFAAAIGCKCDGHRITPALFDASREPRELLLDIARQFSELLLSRESIKVARTCIAEAENHPELSRLFFAAGPERVMGMMTELMAQLNERGKLAIPDARFAAVQFLKMAQGEQRLRLEFNAGNLLPEEEHQRYLVSCVDMFLRAYAV